jgi:hypothetical protein
MHPPLVSNTTSLITNAIEDGRVGASKIRIEKAKKTQKGAMDGK